MIEVVALVVLLGKIGDMARRRGRSPNLFGLMLVICWCVGEIAGGILGFILGLTLERSMNVNPLVFYTVALLGGALGGWIAFRIAGLIDPVGGVWREPEEFGTRRYRLLGAVVGGVVGVVMGAFIVWMTHGNAHVMAYDRLILLAAGFMGALFGVVSGVQKG